MTRKKRLMRTSGAPSISPKQWVAVLVYYRWLTSQVITVDVPFSEIYSRVEVETNESSDRISLNFDEQGLEMNLPSDPQVLFQFDNILPAEVAQFVLDNPQIIEEFVIEELGKTIFASWKQQSKKVLRGEHKEEKWFRKHLNEVWHPALTLLEILISTSGQGQGSEEFYNTYHPTLHKNDAVVLGLVRRLFSKGIQISLEIHLLLSHGFADGAEARWRTLYETMVISRFISLTGHKTALRYIAHEAVGSYDAIKTHNDAHKMNGSVYISDERLAELKKRSDEVISIFGDGFKFDYAWAGSALQHKGKIKFEHLESFTGYDYLYPLHKEASGNIHSSSRSTYLPLAAPYNNASLVISGPSVFGLGEIIINTAFTLVCFLENMLSAVQSSENKARVVAMYELLNQLSENCAEAERKLVEMASTWPEEINSDQDTLSFSIDELK